MKALLIICEYAAGILMLIITLICILIGLVIALFEIPKYLRNAHK
jgi:hypothetical protein